MKNQKYFKILIKNLLFYFIILSGLIIGFSAFIYRQFDKSLYISVDKEIIQYQKQLEEISSFIITDRDSEEQIEISEEEVTKYVKRHVEKIANPRIITILRNSKGEVISSSLSAKYFADYIGSNEINASKIGKIYEIIVNSKYYYRATTCQLTAPNGESYYVDILINTNSEREMLDSFADRLIILASAVIIMSIFISWYLANKAIMPLVKAYEKQAEFIQNASHELRTPLTIIQAKQEILLQSPQSKIIDKSEDIAVSLNETRRLSKMIKELMDLARSDSNITKPNKEIVDIEELANEIIMPYQEMAKLQNKKMILNIKCNNEIFVDKNKIKQLLVIILDNALKYTEENDSIEVIINNHDEKLFITIKDTGIGISDKGIKHVFERFYREDKARSREKGGTGLGLSIDYTIVKSHGGSIKLSHNKPKGTIVSIRIW